MECTFIQCPGCREETGLLVDTSVARQEYIEDGSQCGCTCDGAGGEAVSVQVRSGNE